MKTTSQAPTGTCSHCGETFNLYHDRWPEASDQCSRCYSMEKMKVDAAENQTRQAQEAREKRSHQWLELCPDQYREVQTDFVRFPKCRDVMAWKMSKRGILIHGNSQAGKTTAIWKLLHQLFVGYGIQFKAFTESEFHQELASRAITSRKAWLDSLCFTPILFFDDIGHSPAYQKSLEDMLYVVENRTSWKRPILSTTQFTGSELESRASFSNGQKTVQAILNRLRASSEIIEF